MTIQELLKQAFDEDLPNGDCTSDPIIPSDLVVLAQLKAKEDLVLSGSEVFEEALRWQAPSCEIEWFFKDSDFFFNKNGKTR